MIFTMSLQLHSLANDDFISFIPKVNSTVPIASEVYKKHGVYDPAR